MTDCCSCCDQILSGLIFTSVVIFILEMIVVILSDGTINMEEIKSLIVSEKFNEFLIQYSEIDIQCAQDYFLDLEDDNKYFDGVQIVIRVICSISMNIAVCLFYILLL